MEMTQEIRIKRGHIAMMKHPETSLYSGVMMMGTSEVVDTEGMTAYTDGVNKKYGRQFMATKCKTDAEVNGIILHENLHIALRHLLHSRDLFLENAMLANVAADMVVNDIILNLKDKKIATLPHGCVYDPRFHNMNMREVYRILKEENKGGTKGPGGKGSGGGEQQFDEHDIHGQGKELSEEDAKKIDARIDKAIREGAILAGRLGVDLPRAITEMLEPTVDWKDVLRDFVSSTCRGNDEYTWRKFNRRVIANDMYLPTVEDETIGGIIQANDMSGSIGQDMVNMFASELVSISESVTPESIRVLWWDTQVRGEQLFTGDYTQMRALLKPSGGGGTRASCVSEYINKKQLKADCVIVFTDGYLESDVKWDVSIPTLWVVTDNKDWVPPFGKKVFMNV